MAIEEIKSKITDKIKIIFGIVVIIIGLLLLAILGFRYFLSIVLIALPAILLVIPNDNIKNSKIIGIILFVWLLINLVSFIPGIINPNNYFESHYDFFSAGIQFSESNYFREIEILESFTFISCLLMAFYTIINMIGAILFFVPTKKEDSAYNIKTSVNSKINLDFNFCSNCGEKLDAESNFCKNCGEKIVVESTFEKSELTNKKQFSSTEFENNFSIAFCPNCGVEVKKPTIRCLKCGEPFTDLDKKVDEKYIKTNDKSINIKTKHIDKAGVSFDFPEYYLVANVPDNAPDCVIALAKEDGTCDVMIEISSSKDRIRYTDNNFESSYKKYISDLGYYDIKSIPGFGYKKACFQSYINHELGNIKQTTYFDFRFEKDIRITFNTLKNIDYDCMNDLRIIENSINYKKSNIIYSNIDYKKSNIINRIKNKITYKTKTAIGIISILLTLIFIPFLNMDYSIITYPIFYMPTVVPAIFLILPSETIKYNKVLSIISILIVIPFLIFNLNDLIFMVSTLFDSTSYATFLDYIPYETWVVIYCLYNLVCAILLYIPTGAITNKTVNNSLSHNDVNEENKKLSNDIEKENDNLSNNDNKKENNNLLKKDEMNSTSNKSIINFLFYCEDKNSNEIRLSKIKCFSWILAILTGLLIDVHICLIPNSQGIYAENLIFSFIFFGFIMGIVTFIFSSIIVDIYKEHKQ